MSRTARRVLPLLGAAAALSLIAAAIRAAHGRFVAVEVAGGSMQPALEPGDFVIVHRRELPRDAAGLVAYLRGPQARPMLKRVVGLPGESLRVGAHVEVNARPILEPYAHGTPPAASYRAVNRLGADEYFVLGDHRTASTDSRDFGPVRGTDIEGVALVRYWPPERLGRVVRGVRTLAGPASEGTAARD